MPKKRPTNIEFVTELMNFSNYGALAQVFVIEAISKYASMCAEQRIRDNGFLNPDTWQGVAKEIKGKIDKQYGEEK